MYEAFDELVTNKRVLVTGGTGSLGLALAPCLVGAKAKVKIFTRDEKKQLDMRSEFPDFEYILGDIRDPVAVRHAVRDVQIVIHGASLKYVDVSEQQPGVYISTNVVGTQNLLAAVFDEKTVEICIGISSDKACVSYQTAVQMQSGPSVHMGILVGHKLNLPVSTYDGKTIKTGDISGWYKNELGNRKMVRVSFEGARNYGQHKTGVVITDDHLILTTNGWKQAGLLNSNDMLITGMSMPNQIQECVFVGTMLGDSSLTKPSKTGRSYLCCGHAKRQEEWLKTKINAFTGLGGDVIKCHDSRNKKYDFYSWRSDASGYWDTMRSIWYPKNIKIVPRVLVTRALDRDISKVLAAWYLDDGCYVNPEAPSSQSPLARIATHGFTFEDAEWLASILSTYGLTGKIKEHKSRTSKGHVVYPSLCFDSVGSKNLFELIAPGVIPSLRYKIPINSAEYDSSFWDCGEADRYLARPYIVEVKNRPRSVYCIDVPGTSNFISQDIILHNCNPINTYGMTKALLEKLFLEAHSQGGNKICTVFTIARYGNVVGTRGSVVPRWAQFRKLKRPLQITDPDMTRFFFTLDEAIELIGKAGRTSSGLIVSQAMRACTLGQLANIMSVNGVEVVGRRPGEKLHESLLSEMEMAKTWRVGDYFYYNPLNLKSPVMTSPGNLANEYMYYGGSAYTSDIAPMLSDAELTKLLEDYL